jgi:hypothetical protein
MSTDTYAEQQAEMRRDNRLELERDLADQASAAREKRIEDTALAYYDHYRKYPEEAIEQLDTDEMRTLLHDMAGEFQGKGEIEERAIGMLEKLDAMLKAVARQDAEEENR